MTKLNKRRIIILFISIIIFLTNRTKAVEVAIPGGTSGTDKIEYKSEALRDPFQQEEKEIKKEPEAPLETKPLQSLQVQGIVWGSSLLQAIINNKVVGIGDAIEGVRIIDIAKNGVTVIFEKQKYSLSSPSLTNLQGPKKESIP